MACRQERPLGFYPRESPCGLGLQTTAATHLLLEPRHIDANRVPLDQMTNHIQVIVRGVLPSSIMHARAFWQSSLGARK